MIWLLARGHTIADVAAVTSFGRRWIEQLLARYNAHGPEEHSLQATVTLEYFGISLVIEGLLNLFLSRSCDNSSTPLPSTPLLNQ